MGWSHLSPADSDRTICLSLWATGGSAILRLSMSLQRVTASVLMVCVLATSLSGCTSMRPIRPVTDPSVPTRGPLKAGDTPGTFVFRELGRIVTSQAKSHTWNENDAVDFPHAIAAAAYADILVLDSVENPRSEVPLPPLGFASTTRPRSD
jgi:hypothetical protein